ncbi:DUF418 domain-containing protein [Micromonospora sp. CPCC 205371]|nr:DUF418 domain-containing protein [Micromonospora sp. CPCC 205371]
MTTSSQVRVPGPTAVSERALGPDIARGFMLLFIALANSHYFLRGTTVLGGYPRGGSALDSAVTWTVATFVDGRAFPMFGLLFGYGVAQIVRRHDALGKWPVRRLLWRRSLVLVVVGFAHAMLLYVGDILAAYGVLLFFGAFAVRWRSRWLVILAACFFLLTALPSDASLSTSSAAPDASALPPDLSTMFTSRIGVQPFVMLLGPIGFACPFLIGLIVGRLRVLERPERYRRLLATTAAVGIGAAVLGAQPVSLMLAGVTGVPDASTLELIGPLHGATGVLGGFGYAAIITLLADRLGRRRGPIVTAVAATGQRSMTCYLAQSTVWALAFTPFLLDLSGTLTVATTALLATATWIATVVLADRMRRAGNRGPFELLVRRVTYRGGAAGGRAR